MKYLGHKISANGIATDPDKIAVVRDWPRRESVKDLQRFLCFAGFYRRFVKSLSKIAHPLFSLMQGHLNKKKDAAPFNLEKRHQDAFEELKSMLTSSPILAFADYSKPFELHTDASSHGLGAVLYQQQGDQKRVIAFASRGLKPSEMNYPAHKLEFLALKWSITDKFHDYLYGQSFDVWTDNNPLTYVLTTARLDATGQRWIARLASYNFSIHYKSGRTNVDADALSRLPVVQEDVIQAVCQLEDPNLQSDYVSQFAVAAYVLGHFVSEVVDPINVEEIQHNDKEIGCVLRWKEAGHQPSNEDLTHKSKEVKLLCRQWDKLVVMNNTLHRQVGEGPSKLKQLVIPSSHRDHVLTSLHDSLGHPGRDKMTALLKQRFYWPGSTADVDRKVSGCRRCVCRKAQGQKAPIVPILTTQPLELLCIDYLLVEPSHGYEHLLVIVDHFTKFARVIPTKNETAKTTAKALLDNFINIYGYPHTIHSDQGRNFESAIIKELCALTGIKKSRTTQYHPMGNGACEKLNQTILKMLGTLENENKSRWKDYLGSLVHAYNCIPHSTTGFAPYELMFGRVPLLSVDQEFQLKGKEK